MWKISIDNYLNFSSSKDYVIVSQENWELPYGSNERQYRYRNLAAIRLDFYKTSRTSSVGKSHIHLLLSIIKWVDFPFDFLPLKSKRIWTCHSRTNNTHLLRSFKCIMIDFVWHMVIIFYRGKTPPVSIWMFYWEMSCHSSRMKMIWKTSDAIYAGYFNMLHWEE